MNIIYDFLNRYGMMVLYAVLTTIAGAVGTQIRKNLQTYAADQTRSNVVRTCVRAVEQLYRDLHGEEKKEKALESISAILAEKNIHSTPLELNMLIEAVVGQLSAGDRTE